MLPDGFESSVSTEHIPDHRYAESAGDGRISGRHAGHLRLATAAAVNAALDDDPMSADVAGDLSATSGTTNAGIIDDRLGWALSRKAGLVVHVDGAYGGSGIFGHRCRRAKQIGISKGRTPVSSSTRTSPSSPLRLLRASLRQPELARATHTQDGVVPGCHSCFGRQWKPDRLRPITDRVGTGAALWFSLPSTGSRYSEAIEAASSGSLSEIRAAAMIQASPQLQLSDNLIWCGAVPANRLEACRLMTKSGAGVTRPAISPSVRRPNGRGDGRVASLLTSA